ncbi:hypothetical protein [Schleiferilactobacillus harbinensis]|uniref:hypothetical protein n=1 Tax=Schleiferilactobacillus harbinensis TaxID=304207 RepID=UPI00345E64E5
MESDHAVGIDFAASYFNQLLRQYTNPYKQIKLVWNTSLGLAYLRTTHVDKQGNLIFSEKSGPESVDQKIYSAAAHSDKSIFHAIQAHMNDELIMPWGFPQSYLVEHLDLLLERLNKLVNDSISGPKELTKPTYDAFWNFQTLDGSISLPFVSKDQLELKGVASLVLV